MSTATLVVRLPSEVKDQLGRLSRTTKRTNSSLAAEAIASYVTRETEIVAGIMRGIADMKRGRLVLHKAAMGEIADLIDEAERSHA
jgi:predicted transcriptional regulator